MFTPPPFVEKIKYQKCVQINDPVTRKRVYATPDGEKLPSVTTILSATKDMTGLNEWRKRIGYAKAEQITREAAGVGTSLHKNLESFVCGVQRQPGNNMVHKLSNKMADTIIQNGLCNIDEIWAMEQSLYYPGLYSGTTDGIGVHKGTPCCFDYKQTNKPKKEKYVEDYFLQLCAYSAAHNEVYETNIKKGIIFMAVRPTVDPSTGEIGESQYQEFMIEGSDFDYWTTQWFNKVEQYYNLSA